MRSVKLVTFTLGLLLASATASMARPPANVGQPNNQNSGATVIKPDNSGGNTNRNTNRNTQGQAQGQNSSTTTTTNQGQTSSNSNSNNVDAGSFSGSYDGVSGAASSIGNIEGDTTLVLPNPVNINPASNTEPGLAASCADLSISGDYTGGVTTGVTVWVFGFYGQNTPDSIPTEVNDGFKSVITCGLANQLERLVNNSELTQSEKRAAQRLYVDQLFRAMYSTNGMEFKPRFLDLESVGRTDLPTLPLSVE